MGLNDMSIMNYYRNQCQYYSYERIYGYDDHDDGDVDADHRESDSGDQEVDIAKRTKENQREARREYQTTGVRDRDRKRQGEIPRDWEMAGDVGSNLEISHHGFQNCVRLKG